MERFSKNDIKIAAVIPARGGSKGVVRKNVSLVGGKPLIAWTIDAAKACKGLDRVVVNTDDYEIAEVAKAYGAEVPFIRPSELAQDDSPVFEALNHGLDFFELEGYVSTHIMQLNPTSPLRTVSHLDQAIDLLVKSQTDSVVTVTEAHSHPYWCKVIRDDGTMEDFLELGPDQFKIRQQLPKVYSLNGSVFLVENRLIRGNTYYSDKTVPLLMSADDSLDIDTPWEMYLANLVLTDRSSV